MILRWHIFSRTLGFLVLLTSFCHLWAASVTGRVQLIDSHDSAVNKQRDFSGVVVWLRGLDETPPCTPAKHVQMLQKDKKFTPHILAVCVGTSVAFPNLDPIFHNAFSNFNGQIFDIGLYPPGSTKSTRFQRPGVVRVFCNIHPSMSAVIVVLNSPYFAVSDGSGKFSIPNVPAGEYEVHIFHERTTPESLGRLTRTISVGQANCELAPFSISETGYLPVPHKNKYGREYAIHNDDLSGYPVAPE